MPRATWRKWSLSLTNHRRRRGRGLASSSRPFCPSTDTSTSPTTRGEQDLLKITSCWRRKLSLSLSLSLSVKAVYKELHDALMAINDQEDLRWWKNTHGPGMPTDWPQFQVLTSSFLHSVVNFYLFAIKTLHDQ